MKGAALSLLLLTGCATAPAVVAPAVVQLDEVLRDPAVKSLPAASRATLTAAIKQAKAETAAASRWRFWGPICAAFVGGVMFSVLIRRL